MTALHRKPYLPLVAIALACTVVIGCRGSRAGHEFAANGGEQSATAANTPPALAQQGERIFDDTPKYAGQYVGNKLSCSDCHLQSGTAAYSAPMIDIAGLFPMYNKRAGHVISLENRIQECFTRSEAGQPPAVDSAPMKALVAYVDWLSRNGVKGKAYSGRGLVKLPALKGNAETGRGIYAAQCAACHGADGAGIPPVLPALWGSNSYNDGAGMNNPAKMASFVIRNMPQNHPGTLSPQEAFDVAAYIHTRAHPKFNQAYKGY